MSVVGAIIKDGKVVRVVVTQRYRIKNHVGKGESVYIVPKLVVKEPVAWNNIPWVIKQAEDYAAERQKP